MNEPTTACAHCGLPARPVATGPSFCCHGCKAVYELLHASGLGGYYDMRTRLGSPQLGRAPETAAAPGLEHRYLHYDDPQFLARHGARPGELDLRVSGLQCGACVWAIERLPEVLDGVQQARVSATSGRLQLVWDPQRIRASAIAGFLHGLGYPTTMLEATAEQADRARNRRELLRIAITGAVAGNVMLLAFALHAGALSSMDARFEQFFRWLSLVLTMPAVSYGALPFYRAAWAGLRLKTLHMDLPIALGILAGFLASAVATISGRGEVYFDTITILVFLLLIGRRLQHWGSRRASTSTELLHAITPSTARRRQDGAWATVSIGALEPGDRIRVEPGEVFPVDGPVVTGCSHADLQMLTGESRPVPVSSGSKVFAGSRNLSGPVEIRAERWGRRTRAGTLVEHMERAGLRRAPIVQLADRLAGWFVGAVLLLAAVGGAVWWMVDPSRTFDVVVSLLVVSCPCALGLATPMALAVARGQATREGILVKSPAVLEALARVDGIVLDKTGTLTEGHQHVMTSSVDRRWAPWIAAVEARATHPTATAIHGWARALASPAPSQVTAFTEHPGCGVQARVEGHLVRIGSTAWLGRESRGMGEEITRALEQGTTPVLVEIDGRLAGVLSLGDRLRSDATMAVEAMARRGLSLAIRSGDHPQVVRAIARRLGIEDAAGHVSPEQKARELARLRNMVMVGDGVNDAPALRAARVGVAVSGGAETAMEVADVYLTRPGVGPLARLLDGSHRTLAVVRRNLLFSLGYNAVFASLALAGLITPLVAAVLMPASSLTVVASSVAARPFRDLRKSAKPHGDDTQTLPTPPPLLRPESS